MDTIKVKRVKLIYLLNFYSQIILLNMSFTANKIIL